MKLDTRDALAGVLEGFSQYESYDLDELRLLSVDASSHAEYLREGLVLVGELIANRSEDEGLTPEQTGQLGMLIVGVSRSIQTALVVHGGAEHIQRKKYPPSKPFNDSFDG